MSTFVDCFYKFCNYCMKKKIIFIMNPISGSNDKDSVPEIIEKYIDKEKFDFRIEMTGYAGHATEIAQKAVEEGIDVVVAVGGDGTVNEVGKALTNTETALGIIPLGSGNGLARHLAIPLNLKKVLKSSTSPKLGNWTTELSMAHPFSVLAEWGLTPSFP